MAGSEVAGFPVRLTVNVNRATKLSAKDPNGKSDPYCIVGLSCSDTTFRTELKAANLSPVWNESFVFQEKLLGPFVTCSELPLLIIISVSAQRASKTSGPSVDLSMWIALNNIMSVDLGSEAYVVRQTSQKSDGKNANTVSLTISCFDIRSVKLIFVLPSPEVPRPTDLPMKSGTLKSGTPKAPETIESSSSDTGFGQRILRLASVVQHASSGSPTFGKKILRITSEKLGARSRPGGQGKKGVVDMTKSCDESDSSPGAGSGVERTQSSPGLPHATQKRLRSSAIYKAPPSLVEQPSQEEEEEAEEEQAKGNKFVVGSESDEEEKVDGFEDFLKSNGGALPFNMSIPLTLGEGLEAEDGVCVRPPEATPTLVHTLHFRLEHHVGNIADYPPAMTFARKFEGYLELTGWDVYNFPREMDRQGVSEEKWLLTVINGPEYFLCSSYPQLLYVPATAKEDWILMESAKFRSKSRLPALVWVDRRSLNFLMRCAQPLSGASGKHSSGDEELIQMAIKAGPPNCKLIIFDARTFSAATGNKIMGKGTEDIARYPNTLLIFLDIPNIHSVRESYEALRSLCLSPISSKWFSSLENTQWISYISLILKGATRIVHQIKVRGGSALVHCSDGWDRTAQLTSLAQLMMDPYYRTLEGFQVLVDKEWLSFGHKFQHRLGHHNHPSERSPVFLQFLDCVHQLLRQYPKAFEFNLSFLLCIAEHLNTGWFGTFMCNCDRERHQLSLYARAPSLWAHLQAQRDKFTNDDYTHALELILAETNVRRLKLWEEYFLRYDFTALAQRDGLLQCQDTGQELAALTYNLGHVHDSQWSNDTVVWMSDSKTNECCICQMKFSAFKRRRHHCRACGRIFCNECSAHKLQLEHLGYLEPVRVCDECYQLMGGAEDRLREEDKVNAVGGLGAEGSGEEGGKLSQDDFIVITNANPGEDLIKL